jgi:predicted TPR repeat methyltransferase
MAKALKAGGALVFTVEVIADSTRQMQLNPHGRYSHSEAYVRDSLANSKLLVQHLQIVELRLENQRPVEGMLVLAVRAP